ncbi:hypothetical protein BCU93_10535 [Vibrio breoganii]|uniref:hypothetical protein n=1 Tax=Vibrio breoganii TaxID=553239 RepID=UPI000C82DE70|nr:hypothetical protein [Vibrio breoganii]PMG40360.1 hypothetical protein BCU93_10535 [Vibrio breoganii]
MNLKVKGLVLAVVSALVLNGCDSDKVKAELDHAGHEIGDAAHEVGHNIRKEADRLEDKVQNSDAVVEAKLESKFHLLHDDAVYVTKYHSEQAKYVVNLENPVFTDVNFNFTVTPVPNGWAKILSNPTPWTPKAKQNVQRMLGQIAFVINTQEFANRFNTAGLGHMNPNAFATGVDGAVTIPANYEAFKNVVNDKTADWNANQSNTYTISAYGTVIGGNAYGMPGQPKVFLSLHDMSDTPTLHHSASLLLHELTHTFGYSHDNFNDMTPNNVPYYVQAITWEGGMNETDCDVFMNHGHLDLNNHVWVSDCNVMALDGDPATQTPSLTAADGRRYRDINLFARFFGSSDVTKRAN